MNTFYSKKILTLILGAVAVSALVAGCSSSPISGNGSVTVAASAKDSISQQTQADQKTSAMNSSSKMSLVCPDEAQIVIQSPQANPPATLLPLNIVAGTFCRYAGFNERTPRHLSKQIALDPATLAGLVSEINNHSQILENPLAVRFCTNDWGIEWILLFNTATSQTVVSTSATGCHYSVSSYSHGHTFWFSNKADKIMWRLDPYKNWTR